MTYSEKVLLVLRTESVPKFTAMTVPLLSAASKRNVHVKLMLSERAYTYNHRKEHLVSLLDFNKEIGKPLIEIKIFHVRNSLTYLSNFFRNYVSTFSFRLQPFHI